ncbi:MAG: phosphatidylserine decarboxylase [Halobacteriota archaeon]|nr:phosphatidylserine decarboxylase [Halobacteriota archaeon]
MLAEKSLHLIVVSALITLVFGYFSTYSLAVLGVVVTTFLILFFRDPEREPEGNGMVSPADGRIMRIERRRVSIFMNLHDVHVNRSPFSGTVESIEHINGNFKPAYSKDSENNERNIIRISTDRGVIEMVQIAGSFARRIVCYVKEGDEVKRGERIGMIRFGSRVDIKIPKSYEILIKVGERVKAGETIIAID